MKNLFLAGVLSSMLAGIATPHHAHASWSDPTASQYDDSQTSPLGEFAIGVIGVAFGVYGFYKFATRND